MTLPPELSSLFDRTTTLARCFESIADCSTASNHDDSTTGKSLRDGDDSTLVSPLMIFKAGTILYEAESKLLVNNSSHNNHHKTEQQGQQQYEQQYKFLSGAFYDVLAHSNRGYVSRVIFHEINTAFISIVSDFLVKFKSSSAALTAMGSATTGTAEERRLNRNDYDIEKLLESIRALCGIFNALATCEFQYLRNKKEHMDFMQNIFDKKLCNQLVTLYDALLAGDEVATQVLLGNTHGNTNNSMKPNEAKEELKECILSSLSSLLLYGLISPKSKNTRSSGKGKEPSSNRNAPVSLVNEDEAIQQIMEVIQSFTEYDTSFCLGDLQLWQEEKAKLQMQIQQSNQNSDDNYHYHHHQPILQMIQPMFSNEVIAQKEYLISVLKSAPQYNQHQTNRLSQVEKEVEGSGRSTTRHGDNSHNNRQKKISAIDRLIQQVRAIFPHLGEGYIEAALACYSHDIEQTTVALMESEADPNSKSLHPRLRVLDKSLPARRKESKKQYGIDNSNSNSGDIREIDEEDREAMEIQKARIKEMVSAQEEEAYKLGMAMGMNEMEYNDDYDDQYDGIGDDGGATGGIGGADAGLYDMDFESIRTYNKVAKEVESDRLFWEENRNTNRSQRSSGNNLKKSDNDDDDSDHGKDNSGNDSEEEGDSKQKKYRGPDKGKGGRIIGPDGRYLPLPKSRKKVAKANQNNASTSATTSTKNNNHKENNKDGKSNNKKGNNDQQLSKIQKRRKNDNKAKIANHHRKERALKKSGM